MQRWNGGNERGELWADVRLQVYDFAKDKPALVSWLLNASQSKFALGGSKHSQLIEELGKKRQRENKQPREGLTRCKWHQGWTVYRRNGRRIRWEKQVVSMTVVQSFCCHELGKADDHDNGEERSENRKQKSWDNNGKLNSFIFVWWEAGTRKRNETQWD